MSFTILIYCAFLQISNVCLIYVFFKAEENDGEPVDDLALMKRAYTKKKTGQIDDGLVREVVTLVQIQVQDEVSQLQTEDDDLTASTDLSRVRINEIVESVSFFFLKVQFNYFLIFILSSI